MRLRSACTPRLRQRGFISLPGGLGIQGAPTGGSGDPFWSNVVLLINAEATPIADMSSYARTVTLFNQAARSTAEFKHGAASVVFDGVTDYMSVPNSASLALGNDAFTIETWFYARSLSIPATLLNTYTGAAPRGLWRFAVTNNTTLQFRESDTQIINRSLPSGTIALNTWHHAAVTRTDAASGNTLRIWFNGQQLGTDATLAYNFTASNGYHFGSMAPSYPSDDELDGYVDDMRVTVGVARYSANFTPPGPLPTF